MRGSSYKISQTTKQQQLCWHRQTNKLKMIMTKTWPFTTLHSAVDNFYFALDLDLNSSAVSSFVKFCNSNLSFISKYHTHILFFAKFSRNPQSMFEQAWSREQVFKQCLFLQARMSLWESFHTRSKSRQITAQSFKRQSKRPLTRASWKLALDKQGWEHSIYVRTVSS